MIAAIEGSEEVMFDVAIGRVSRASRRRKTLIVCCDCRGGIHSGFPVRHDSMESTLESRVR